MWRIGVPGQLGQKVIETPISTNESLARWCRPVVSAGEALIGGWAPGWPKHNLKTLLEK
jgi:hypothetical protein